MIPALDRKQTPIPLYPDVFLAANFAVMKNSQSPGREHYLALYQDWKSSELPIGLFCERASVKYATFRYWVKKFETPDLAGPGFTLLQVDPVSSAPVAVLNFPTGASVSFFQLPDAGWLKTLLS